MHPAANVGVEHMVAASVVQGFLGAPRSPQELLGAAHRRTIVLSFKSKNDKCRRTLKAAERFVTGCFMCAGK